MKLRLTSFLLVVLLIMALVPAVSAQDDCLGLNEADCAIFMNAMASDAEVTSANMTYDFSLNISGIGLIAPGTDSMSVTSSGSGAYNFDTSATDVTGLSLQMDTSSSADFGAGSQGGDFNFRIVDGFFYMQDPVTGQWVGFDLEAAMDEGVMPVDPMMFGDTSGGFDPSVFTEMLTGLGITDVSVNDVLSLTREADQDRMGQSMYVFTLSMDFGPIFQSANFQQTITSLMSVAGGDDPQVAQIGAMVGPLLQGSSLVLNVTQLVGVDDGYVHAITITMNAEVDLSALFGAVGGGAGGNAGAPQMPPITLDMTLDIGFENINGEVSVSAPEGAEIIDPADFDGFGGFGF